MSLIKPDKLPVIVLAFANEHSESGYLRGLTREMKAILRVMEPAVQRGRAFIKLIPAATQEEIAQVFQDEWYDDRIWIFHYAGHADEDELWLESSQGGNQSFFSLGLARFLGAQDGLELVFLNGCATGEHARLLHEANLPAVVTTSRKINDDQAVEFATVFYRGLAGGASIQESFDEAEGVLLGLYNPASFKSQSPTRSLYWEEETEGPQPELDLPWRLTFRKQAEWVPAQWRLFYELSKDSQQAPPDTTALIGKKINNYEIVELLGQGAMGTVFRAVHTTLNEERAIKVTHRVLEGYDHLKSLVIGGNKGLSTLDHPNIAEFHDVGEFDFQGEKRLYMVMELVKGERLDKMDYSTFWTSKEDLRRLTRVMIQLFSGLHAAHSTQFQDASGAPREGIIHGNIKTRKILFTPKGQPKLIDFLFTDLTRSLGIKLDWPAAVQQRMRSEDPEEFLAPELRKGTSGPDQRTDIYALGAVFFEVITQTSATQLRFGTYQELHEFVRRQNSQIPRDLTRFLWEATHPKFTLRFATASAATEHLLKSIPWYRRFMHWWRDSNRSIMNQVNQYLPSRIRSEG
jgi:serine/threonine protein kinase